MTMSGIGRIVALWRIRRTARSGFRAVVDQKPERGVATRGRWKSRAAALDGGGEKKEREWDQAVFLMLGRDDHLLLGYLDWSAVQSDNDVPTWRSGGSLR